MLTAIFSGHAWIVKVVIVLVVPAMIGAAMLTALPWALLVLSPMVLALALRRPLLAVQIVAAVLLCTGLIALLQQLVAQLTLSVATRTIAPPAWSAMVDAIPGHLLHYAAPGANGWQYAGRLAAIIGVLIPMRLIPIAIPSGLFGRMSPKYSQDASLGTARWAGWSDLRGQAQPGWPRPGHSGIVVGKLRGKVIRLTPKAPQLLNSHVLVIGASGAGKSTGYVLPNIYAAAMAGESIVLTDPKGELLASTAAWLTAQGYGIRVFAPGQKIGDGWNPLLDATDETEIDLLASAILDNAIAGAQDKSTFFAAAERYLLKMLIFAVRAHPTLVDEQRTLPVLLRILSSYTQSQMEHFVATSTSPDALDTLAVYSAHAGQHSPALGLAAKLSPLNAAAPNLAKNEIDMSQIKHRKTALFCILPVGNLNFAPILAAFYAFLFRRLAEAQGPYRVRLILDEFANLGKIPGFAQQLAVGRGLGIDISIILQNLSQLEELYSRPTAGTIQSNCATHLLLGTNDQETSRVFSASLGDTAVRQQRNRRVRDSLLSHTERDEITIKRCLMSPDEVRRLTNQVLVVTAPFCLLADKLNFRAEPPYKIMTATQYVPPVLQEIDILPAPSPPAKASTAQPPPRKPKNMF